MFQTSFPWLASWACSLGSRTRSHPWKSPVLGLTLCCCYVEILNIVLFERGALHFHFALDLANYPAGPDQQSKFNIEQRIKLCIFFPLRGKFRLQLSLCSFPGLFCHSFHLNRQQRGSVLTAFPGVASVRNNVWLFSYFVEGKCSLLLFGTLSRRQVWLCDSSEIRKTNTVNGELEKQVGTISPPKRMDLRGNLFMG